MSNLSGFVKRIRDIMRNDAGINGDAQRIEQIAWMLFLKVYDAKEQDWEFDDESYQSIIPEECRWANWAHDDKSGAAITGDKLLNFVNNVLFPTLKSLPVDAETPIIPIYTYDPIVTLKAQKELYERGVYVNATLPPACAPGECLLRCTLMATHSEALIDEAVDIIADVLKGYDIHE